jgi:hypothetical protein
VHIFTLFFSFSVHHTVTQSEMSNKLQAEIIDGPLGSFLENSQNRKKRNEMAQAIVAHSPVNNEHFMQYTSTPPLGIGPNAVPILIWMAPELVSMQYHRCQFPLI